MMDWKRLLSTRRFGQKQREPVSEERSPFHKDMDRVVFSSAFRRLQDKTQVHSLPDSDYVRTRLTHSIEVASVGRSLGAAVGQTIIDRHLKGEDYTAADFGHIVSAACLAHDIGNPPFGHFGENIIRHWFARKANETDIFSGLSDAEKADFLGFEGNAQGFRVLNRLQNIREKGGLRLTYATLGTFTKYPRASIVRTPRSADDGARKFGFFQSERDVFRELADEIGLVPIEHGAYWCRHPLAYLVEAADDICYLIIDLEDGFKLGRISFEDAESRLISLAGGKPAHYGSTRDESDRIGYLRAKAIGRLVNDTAQVFIDNEEALGHGTFKGNLLEKTEAAPILVDIYKLAHARLFRHPERLQAELGGAEILTTLLDAYVTAFLEKQEAKGEDATISPKSEVLLQLLPEQAVTATSRYEGLLSITDFVSGMTDSYALTQFRRLRGLFDRF
jgi:dGTPase